MAKEDVQKCLEWLLNTQVSLLLAFLFSHSRTLSSMIVCKKYESIYLAKIPLICCKLCRNRRGGLLFNVSSTLMFVQYIFADKTIVISGTCGSPSRCLKCIKITVHFFFSWILQINVRHKVLYRSECVKYMFTSMLFMDLTMIIRI